jgi:hypothetical protein
MEMGDEMQMPLQLKPEYYTRLDNKNIFSAAKIYYYDIA